ncbi:hypothetical protein HDU76_011228, partial [Blyttiomyces sp. JEL0837]
VVVAIRGTLSTADVLVDLNCDLTTLQVPSLDGGQPTSSVPIRTHSGMLMTAGNIRDEIAGLLDELLLNPTSLFKEYRLVICGHSLGAGVASLLTLLLRIRNLPAICYAYSPPGAITDPVANETYFTKFCTSIVLGDDIVPRLNRRTVEHLKRRVKAAVRCCGRRKVEVLGGFFATECLGVTKIPFYGGGYNRDREAEEFDFDEWWRGGLGPDEGGSLSVASAGVWDDGDLEAGIRHVNNRAIGGTGRTTTSSSPLTEGGGDDDIDEEVDADGHPRHGPRQGGDIRDEVMQLPGRVLYFKKERVWVDVSGDGSSSPSRGSPTRRGNHQRGYRES